MSTPIETATETILSNMTGFGTDRPGWLTSAIRDDVRDTLASLAQHRDDIGDVIDEAADEWASIDDRIGGRGGFIFDAVLAYLTREPS